MVYFFSRFMLFTVAITVISSCQTVDDPASMVAPDRGEEGFTGPGIRMTDDSVDTNRLDRITRSANRPTNYERERQSSPVEGIDFFQYKKKF